MRPIKYVVGDATLPNAYGPVIIAHCCEDVGPWLKGFAGAVRRRWRLAEVAYRNLAARAAPLPLGYTQFVQVDPTVCVANIIAQVGVSPADGPPPLSYDALETGLVAVAERARATLASVHMPRLGTGRGGGDWIEIEPIIERTLCAENLTVFVYDPPATAASVGVV